MERIDHNGTTYWRGFGERGKRRYSFDAGRTWASSIVDAGRAALIRAAEERIARGTESAKAEYENLPDGTHLRALGRKVEGPFEGHVVGKPGHQAIAIASPDQPTRYI